MTLISRLLHPPGRPGPTITVTSASGFGSTKIGAFDAALRNAGIANFNLVQLSSVVPPGSSIRDLKGAPATVKGEWGDRLYVVMADGYAEQPGEQAWAGIGWIQQERTRKGLFVEDSCSTEDEVDSNITGTLEEMSHGRREPFDVMSHHLRGAVSSGSPVCALVVAVFEPQAWIGESSPPPELEVRSRAVPIERRAQPRLPAARGPTQRSRRWRRRRGRHSR
jgi:arginine decarboxylase